MQNQMENKMELGTTDHNDCFHTISAYVHIGIVYTHSIPQTQFTSKVTRIEALAKF